MREDETIAVVIPLYNHGSFIEEALRSVTSQRHLVDSIIVIDDGSQDQSLQLAKDFLSRYSNATVYSQANQGAHTTLNRAIDLAGDKWIAILNSDDAFSLDKLSNFTKLAREFPDARAFATGVTIIDQHSQAVSSGRAHEWLALARSLHTSDDELSYTLIQENYLVTTSNLIFSREVWEKLGGFAPLRYCHDLEFLLKLSRHNLLHVDLSLEDTIYRIHDSNTISEDIHLIIPEIVSVLADHIWELKSLGTSAIDMKKAAQALRARGLNMHVASALVRRAQYSNSINYFQAPPSTQTREIKIGRFFLSSNLASLLKALAVSQLQPRRLFMLGALLKQILFSRNTSSG